MWQRPQARLLAASTDLMIASPVSLALQRPETFRICYSLCVSACVVAELALIRPNRAAAAAA